MKSKHYNKTTEILGKHSVMVEFGIQIFFTCKENTESKLYNKQKKNWDSRQIYSIMAEFGT